MIYGYVEITENSIEPEQLESVTIQADQVTLLRIAKFLEQTAEDPSFASSHSWHRHIPEDIAKVLGCDLVVLGDRG